MPEFQQDDNTLLLYFQNGRPLRSDELGMLLKELGADYKRLTGRELTLWRYETGSSWILLRDTILLAGNLTASLTDIASAAKNLLILARALGGFYNGANDANEERGVEKVAKSATRIAKIAAESGSDLDIKYKNDPSTGGESFSIKMTSARAAAVTKVTRQKKQKPKTLQLDHGAFDHPQPNIVSIARELAGNPEGADEVVETIVTALIGSGGTQFLPQLANALEASGRQDLAKSVRRHSSRLE